MLGYHGCDRTVGERLIGGAPFKPSDNGYDWLCLDLTTSDGVDWMRFAYQSLAEVTQAANLDLPVNGRNQLKRNLDCSVVRRLHTILEDQELPAVDTLKGVFTEGPPAYPGGGFAEKTHIQVAVRNFRCIKGVFRVPLEQLRR